MKTIKNVLVRSTLFLAIFTLFCGVLYTGIITVSAQLFFPNQANGSVIKTSQGNVSSLMGQNFTDSTHLWGRIMNLDFGTYQDAEGNALMYAVPSNLSPASEEYNQLIQERIVMLQKAHPEMGNTPIPVDLLTCSGSGLDPEISIAAAHYQIERLAKENQCTTDEIQAIFDECTTQPFLGILGEKTINVVKVNLLIDQKFQ